MEKYPTNSPSDSQGEGKPGSVDLDDLDQVGSRRLVLPREKTILTLLGSTANRRAQPHETAQPLSVCICHRGKTEKLGLLSFLTRHDIRGRKDTEKTLLKHQRVTALSRKL